MNMHASLGGNNGFAFKALYEIRCAGLGLINELSHNGIRSLKDG